MYRKRNSNYNMTENKLAVLQLKWLLHHARSLRLDNCPSVIHEQLATDFALLMASNVYIFCNVMEPMHG